MQYINKIIDKKENINLWGGSPAELCTGNNLGGCSKAAVENKTYFS